MEINSVNRAVCVLIPCENGFLCVSRRNDASQWGLPGGKVDKGDTEQSAIAREVAEELDIPLILDKLVPVYSGICYGPKNFWTTTYVYLPDVPVTMDHIGKNREQDLFVRVLTQKELCAKSISPFYDYNRELFRSASAFFFIESLNGE